jgi:hypothetical protein
VAKEAGYTFAGEMFSASNMVALASRSFGSGICAELFDDEWDDQLLHKILQHLQTGGLILTPFVFCHH